MYLEELNKQETVMFSFINRSPVHILIKRAAIYIKPATKLFLVLINLLIILSISLLNDQKILKMHLTGSEAGPHIGAQCRAVYLRNVIYTWRVTP